MGLNTLCMKEGAAVGESGGAQGSRSLQPWGHSPPTVQGLRGLYGEAWLASQIASCWMQGWACVKCNAWALDLGHPGVGAELDEFLTHSGPQCAHL